jgi:uncharacterized repeat protein (TIGR01451 family)
MSGGIGWNRVRERPSLLAGLGLAAAGILLLAAPGLASAVPGNDYLVIGVGVLALLAGLRLAARRRKAEIEGTDTGDPELRIPVPAPGDTLAERLRRIELFGRRPQRTRRRIRERLRDAAVAVVRRRRRCSREEARRLVLSGEWTDDPHAAVFVGGEGVEPPPLLESLSASVALQSRFGFRARRTMAAILSLSDTPVDDDEFRPIATRELAPGPATEADPQFTDRRTDRWTGVGALALLAGAAGMAFRVPSVLLLAIVGVTYAAYARQATAPSVELDAERELSDSDPDPGDEVDVTVTVSNEGAERLPDLRLVDGVPPGLSVVEGSPRLGTALKPGRTATFSYTVTARRGDHEFGPLQVIARDASGAAERELSVDAPGALTSVPDHRATDALPLYGTATRYTGRVSTDTGGEGVEFFATREYRPGDPPSRIDWNRHARTRELATLLFRREQAATVVLLIDGRAEAYRAPGPDAEHAVDRSVDAAGETFESLLAAGDRVGVASFGPRDCWVGPGAGQAHRERVRRTLATHEAFSDVPPDGEFLPSVRLAELRSRAPTDAQFVLFSPVTDDYVATVGRRLQAYGYPVTVVSADVTTPGQASRQLVRVERRIRLNRLRERGIRVVDWADDEEYAVALRRAREGWSA